MVLRRRARSPIVKEHGTTINSHHNARKGLDNGGLSVCHVANCSYVYGRLAAILVLMQNNFGNSVSATIRYHARSHKRVRRREAKFELKPTG